MVDDPPLDNRGWLHRGNLRDIVIALSLASSLAFSVGGATLAAALGVLAAGTALHVLVKGQLVRDVVLCTRGSYALVRHPYYLANYLIDSSFCLASGNLYLVLAYPFLFFWAYGPTLREEEKRLAARHGSEFIGYATDVPQVFPHRFSFSRWRLLLQGFSWRRITGREVKRAFRFWCVGMLFGLVHYVKAANLVDDLFGRGAGRHAAIGFAALCAAFLVIALFPRRRPAAQSR